MFMNPPVKRQDGTTSASEAALLLGRGEKIFDILVGKTKRVLKRI
jgi:hypothetical protein